MFEKIHGETTEIKYIANDLKRKHKIIIEFAFPLKLNRKMLLREIIITRQFLQN